MASPALAALYAKMRVIGTLRSFWDGEEISTIRDLANFYEDVDEVMAHLNDVHFNGGAIDNAILAWQHALKIIKGGLPEDEGGPPDGEKLQNCAGHRS